MPGANPAMLSASSDSVLSTAGLLLGFELVSRSRVLSRKPKLRIFELRSTSHVSICDKPFVGEISLVADKHDEHVGATLGPHVVNPLGRLLE